jgi:hypothetical protein
MLNVTTVQKIAGIGHGSVLEERFGGQGYRNRGAAVSGQRNNSAMLQGPVMNAPSHLQTIASQQLALLFDDGLGIPHQCRKAFMR